MSVITKGKSFANGEQLTADKINNIVDLAVFNPTEAVDNSSTLVSGGAITVKDGGITSNKLATSSVTSGKLATDSVTTDKILDANVTFGKLTDVIDDDTMATASDTTLSTSESIKAYVNTPKDKCLVGITSNLTVGSVPYTVPFNQSISDVANMHDTVANNSRITIGTAGIYLITATIETSEVSNGDIGVDILKNGSTISRVRFDSGSTDGGQAINISHMASLSVSDYIEAQLFKIAGSTTTITTRTSLSVAELA
jgi:hypothetical protein